MNQTRRTVNQIREIVVQIQTDLAQGMALDGVRAKYDVSRPKLRRWLREYGGRQDDPVHRVDELQRENERLRQTVKALELDKRVLSEVARGNC